jgi:hypothetical protein
MMGLLPQIAVASTFKPLVSVRDSNVGNGRPVPEFPLASEMGTSAQSYQQEVISSNSVKPITPSIVRRIEKSILNLCREVENQSSPEKLGERAGEFQFPAAYVLDMLESRFAIEPQSKVLTQITKQPLNGKLTPDRWTDPTRKGEYKQSIQQFNYIPCSNFYGKDRYEFEVTINGKVFRGAVNINVVKTWNNGETCAPPGQDRGEIEADTQYAWDLESLDEIIPAERGDLIVWQRSAQLSALIASGQQCFTGFIDLPSTASGETTGAGILATITLDTNGVGHGWYIDPTPLDNSVAQFKAEKGAALTPALSQRERGQSPLHPFGHA